MITIRRLSKALGVSILGIGLTMASGMPVATADALAANSTGSCQQPTIPVSLTEGQPNNQTVAATYCTPKSWQAGTALKVDILLPGATYNRTYWDWPSNQACTRIP